MATVTLTATFPIVDSFLDYHDIQEFADTLNMVFDKPVRNAELSYADGFYWGVFYVGRKPAKAVIDKMLADAGFVEDNGEDW